MTTLYELNDKLKGDKIVCEARYVDKPKVISNSGRHKIQRVTLKDNVTCTVIKKARFVTRNPD
ncbi:hypothetical protein [Methanobrevibacter sp.]|uniref:hypothetical protein n=1 Tax=Methanobrevibacter sp. TaxID=66852 RepID=UPI003867DAAD